MLASGRLWLTADELTALIATIKEQGDQYRDRTAGDRPEGSRRVRLGVQLFPVDRARPNRAEFAPPALHRMRA